MSELLSALRSRPDADSALLVAIEALVEPMRLGSVSINVTVHCVGDDKIVKDGNKRTVAAYEISRERRVDEISFPVFVLRPYDR